jgi:DNA-binding response OmpR family regulator
MRILVADDDVITLTRLQRMLRSLGHEVEIVRDGFAASKYLEKSPGGSVAILNSSLPGKAALDITSEFRSRSRLHYTYVIVVASNNEKCNAVTALEAGADGFLGVPFSAAALTAQLKAAERILKDEEHLQKTIAELQEQLRSHLAQPPCLDHGTAPQTNV